MTDGKNGKEIKLTIENIYKLNTTHWSHKLGTIGEIVKDIDDIKQCYSVIFATQKGSVLLNPNLGWNIRKYFGQPLNIVGKEMRTELLKELNYQEQRAKVQDVFLFYDQVDKGKLKARIKFQYFNITENAEVSI